MPLQLGRRTRDEGGEHGREHLCSWKWYEEHDVENIMCSQGDIKNTLFFACVPGVS